ncbi:MAG TPA: glycosyltransferase [Opitutae bacterium]|nr:glycosyltransferase [Opitutae bacterium]
MPSAPQPSISILIPVYNEAATLATLHQRILSTLQAADLTDYEICFIDDGSTDQSWEAIAQLTEQEPAHTSAIRFRRNFGKADALQAGFNSAKGDIIFTMDADLQDDPKEIPAFLEKLNEGYDLVSGWKEVRHDPLSKTLPSKIFNSLARALSGVQLHDFNCGFKAYKKEVTENISLFGELHRFIPILAHAEGYKIGELSVEHHPREHGVSKYGGKRFVKGFLDLLTVTFTTRYLRRPAHIFGAAGITSGTCGFIVLVWLSFSKLILGNPIGTRPLFFLGILLVLLGVQLLSLGLIAEMILRNGPKASTHKQIQTNLPLKPNTTK